MQYAKQFMPTANMFKIIFFSIVSSYAYILMEWLFFITKQSFFDNLNLTDCLHVLFITPLFLIMPCLLILTPVILIMIVFRKNIFVERLGELALMLPAFILATIIFLMIDNFTYTILKVNVGSFRGLTRFLYAAIFVLLCLWMHGFLVRWCNLSFWEKKASIIYKITGALVILSTFIAIYKLSPGSRATSSSLDSVIFPKARLNLSPQDYKDRNFPNILILSTDGLNAAHMSAYGYHRKTTPFIDMILPECLLVENHFTNCAKSTGSIGSLLSGKLPIQTKVIYPPDIFRGRDSYEHLPGILKKLGYRNADLSIRHYTDPCDLNMRDGFDYANGRKVVKFAGFVKLPHFIQSVFLIETYFLEQTISRILFRLQHVFGVNYFVNPYAEVKKINIEDRLLPDNNRIRQLIDFIDKDDAPFFAHVHFMITHGAQFNPSNRVFSVGKEQKSLWMTDFYDDTILDYDEYVKKITQYLKKNNKFENTIIILTSDHGMDWRATERIPLIIRFPNQQYRDTITNNVQRIDVAPTILEYLKVNIPDWFEGSSFLTKKPNKFRPVIFADSGTWGPMVNGWRVVKNNREPFYSLGGIGAIISNRWYFLNLENKKISSDYVQGHTSPCNDKDLPSVLEIWKLLISRLKDCGYDTTSLTK
jgi:hypothetical protein